MAKQRVSDEELHKTPPPGLVGETLHIQFFKEYLENGSFEDLSRAYNISRGQVQIRINDVMQKLPELLGVTIVDNRLIRECLDYKKFWLNLIHTYNITLKLNEHSSIFPNFLAWFKKQSDDNKEFIVKTIMKEYEK